MQCVAWSTELHVLLVHQVVAVMKLGRCAVSMSGQISGKVGLEPLMLICHVWLQPLESSDTRLFSMSKV